MSAKATITDLLQALGPNEAESLANFQKAIAADASLAIPRDILREHPTRFALRFLRADDYDTSKALERVKFYIEVSRQFKFWGPASDSMPYLLNQNGPLWPCGLDKHGNYSIVMRPCVHLPKSTADSDQAVLQVLHTMRLCADCLPSGHEKMSVIYDASKVTNKNFDLRFVKALAKYLGMCFPERIGRIFVVNNGVIIQGLWKVVKTFLDPVTASKIVFCGTKIEVLMEQFDPNHPFVQYLQERKMEKGSKAKDRILMPHATQYQPTWEGGVMEDARDLSPGDVEVALLEKEEIKVEVEAEASSVQNVENSPVLDVEIAPAEEAAVENPAEEAAVEAPAEDAAVEAPAEEAAVAPQKDIEDFDAMELVAIANQLMAAVEIKDRMFHLRTYPACFLGSEAVEALIKLGHAENIEQAETLGDLLIGDNLMKHIANDHGLKNQYLFYIFPKRKTHLETSDDGTNWSQLSATSSMSYRSNISNTSLLS
jgi:hypothetical protein